MTDPIGLADALAALQAKLPHITKDETARVVTKDKGTYSYSYANLASISKLLLPALAKHGLSFIAKPGFDAEGRFVLAYALMHTSGETERGQYPLPLTGSPQQIGSAITYARRYCLCAVTGAAADEDDDDAQAAEAVRAQYQRPPEVDEHGAATVAEQTRMVTGPVPGTVRTRPVAPVDDIWTTSEPEKQPGSSLPSQRQAIVIKLTKAGIETQDAQRAECSRIAGRPIESRTDLSYAEAVAVLADNGKQAT
jgi:hypothetical protein